MDKELASVIRGKWDKRTCYPPLSERWSTQLPELGQCAVTALVIHELYGGQIAFNRHFNHFWNVLPNGETVDLTKNQFHTKARIKPDAFIGPEQILYSPEAARQKTLWRFNLLKKRISNVVQTA